MFDQTLGGTLRNLAIGLVLTAAVVGAGFALAFSLARITAQAANPPRRGPHGRALNRL